MTTRTIEPTGEVVRAGDPGYETARQGYNRLYQRYPEAIVFCHNTSDVVNAIRWAREAGIAFRARSGGHSLEGWSVVDGGLVIDVSRMKNIDVDEASGTATVGTGLRQQEVVAALGERGYTIPTGSLIFISPYVMHRDPRYFDNPDAFIPERWADGLDKRIPRYAYFPFGGGPRVCIGNQFALMEAKLVLATIAARYQLALASSEPVELDPLITLRPKAGIDMRLTTRQVKRQPATAEPMMALQ